MPKHWNVAKAPRHHPDIPTDVLVWRKGMQAERQVLVARLFMSQQNVAPVSGF